VDNEEQKPKRGRKPVGPVARTPAQRKRDQRERLAEAVHISDSHEWTEAVCLSILNGKRWRGGAIDKAAWQQLGKLRSFM